jgi:hypothetical protein
MVSFLWGVLSDERTGLSFIYAAGPRQIAFLGSESLGTRGHILLFQIWDLPFVASYDSHGHGGGIRPRLQTSKTRLSIAISSYIWVGFVENTSVA